jgi:hypothetical protein
MVIGTIYTELRKNENQSSDGISEDFKTCKKFTFNKLRENKQLVSFDKFWSCFAFQKNYNFIMSPNLGNESLEPIHGLRVYGMMWILIGK